MLARWESSTRYYVAFVYKDLLNDTILAEHWGGKDNRLGNRSYTVMNNKEQIQNRIAELDKRRTARGYTRQQ